jgi:SAM-dependent methyltransferase
LQLSHSLLLEKAAELLLEANIQAPVLDLACGSGRNGLYLMTQNIPVVFADIKESALEQVKTALCSHDDKIIPLANFWQVDLEQDDIEPLSDKSFSAVIVFRYLHRTLFEQIKQTVLPGGYVVYETFTVDQPQFGRPKNPRFLLKSEELAERFSDWHIIHSFEGVIDANNESGKQAVAQIIARKPTL